MTLRNTPTDIDIHPLLAGRWSPRAYSDQAVAHSQVLSLLEAARWAPSAYNAQPWRFVVFEKAVDLDAFNRAFATLIPFNQSWNTNAQVLFAVLTDTQTAKGTLNATAGYDAGAAAMALLLEAHARGLAAHAMSGIDAAAFRDALAIPARYEVLTMISVAHHGDPQSLPTPLNEREVAPRVRLSVNEFAHFGAWRE